MKKFAIRNGLVLLLLCGVVVLLSTLWQGRDVGIGEGRRTGGRPRMAGAVRTKLDRSWNDGVVTVDEKEALRLKKKIRVLVWVMTSPNNTEKAHAVKATWGTRLNPDLPLLFFSSKADPDLPAIRVNTTEGRKHLLAKTMQAFDYIYKHYYHKADFFMKADDDTYIIMENLRLFLSHLDPSKAFLTGRHLKNYVKRGFPNGGAGYILSKAALKLLAGRENRPGHHLCKEDNAPEDIEISRCLDFLGVPMLNSSDQQGGSRFHPYPPMHHVVAGLRKDWQHWEITKVRVGPEAINHFPISFHYITPNDMKLMHYFVYHMRPYGYNYNLPS